MSIKQAIQAMIFAAFSGLAFACGSGDLDEGYTDPSTILTQEDEDSMAVDIGELEQAFTFPGAGFGRWTSASNNAEARCPATWSTGRCVVPADDSLSFTNQLPNDAWPKPNSRLAAHNATIGIGIDLFQTGMLLSDTSAPDGTAEEFIRVHAADVPTICGGSSTTAACAIFGSLVDYTSGGKNYRRAGTCRIVFTDASMGQTDLENILRHEVAHCAGFDHTQAKGANYLMTSVMVPGPIKHLDLADGQLETAFVPSP